jgi:hypothetical protein
VTLPKSTDALVLRTDFSDDSVWNSLCVAIREPDLAEGFVAYVECVNDPIFGGLVPDQIAGYAQGNEDRSYVFLVDATTFAHEERPILVVDLFDEPRRTFRVVPRYMWSVENNLTLANMDFDDYADAVEADGVFRGFPKS